MNRRLVQVVERSSVQPDDFKPVPVVGQGVEEVRAWDETGTYRVIYAARRAEAVYVLHFRFPRIRRDRTRPPDSLQRQHETFS